MSVEPTAHIIVLYLRRSQCYTEKLQNKMGGDSQGDKIEKYETTAWITQMHNLSNCGLKAVLGFDHDNWKKGVKASRGCFSLKQQTLIASYDLANQCGQSQ